MNLTLKKQLENFQSEEQKKPNLPSTSKKIQKIEPLAPSLPLSSKLPLSQIPKILSSRHSSKQNGLLTSYAANTHNGNIRTYNEDRVSIILNISRPENKRSVPNWPECSLFAVYDGHGGSRCADMLRD
jgi:protein phosphatase 2C family protein 2/3